MEKVNRRIAAIVVAAGAGRRMGDTGEDLPKQFVEVEGRPLFVNSLLPFEAHPLVQDITVVLPPGRLKGWEDRLRHDFGLEKILAVVAGGAHRCQSVRLGLEAASAGQPWPEDALVAVHDGVRPLLSIALLSRVIEAALDSGAAVPALSVADTVVEVDEEDGWGGVVDRSRLRLVQTPQVFRAGWLEEAHRSMGGEEATDDAQLVRALGHPISLVAGEVVNIKVTDLLDMELVHYLVAGGNL